MNNFIIGVVAGIVLATVGFNGIVQMGNRAVQSIESFSQNSAR